MEKIAISFQRMRFVVQVRCFGDAKIRDKFLSENFKAVCTCRVKE